MEILCEEFLLFLLKSPFMFEG